MKVVRVSEENFIFFTFLRLFFSDLKDILPLTIYFKISAIDTHLLCKEIREKDLLTFFIIAIVLFINNCFIISWYLYGVFLLQ